MEDVNPKRVIPAAAFVACAVAIAVFGKARLNSSEKKESSAKNAVMNSSKMSSSKKSAATKKETVQPSEIEILVQIDGAVSKPGLYRVSKGIRVDDLIVLAGNLIDGADLSKVNRAAILKDGEKIVVPYLGSKFTPFRSSSAKNQLSPEPPEQSAKLNQNNLSNSEPNSQPSLQTEPVFPVALNSATKEQLENLPGVGPSLASKILEYRDGIGGFKSVEELDQVRGIGPALMEKIRPLVTL